MNTFFSLLVWDQPETYKFMALQAVCVLSAWAIASRGAALAGGGDRMNGRRM
jgi:hypothetical protein